MNTTAAQVYQGNIAGWSGGNNMAGQEAAKIISDIPVIRGGKSLQRPKK